MTVVLALACADGVVLAADSQVTDPARGMSYPAQKLHLMGDRAAWAGSGARSVLGELRDLFDENAEAILESENVARALQEQALPVLRYHYEHFIEDVPGEDGGGTPSAYVLASGHVEDQPWIVEINPHGMASRYEDIGFHGIGSGAPMAQQAGALLAHFRMPTRHVDYGVVAAVRVLDALSLTMPSVGGPLDVCRISSGKVDQLDDDEIDDVRAEVERWKELEQGALDELLA